MALISVQQIVITEHQPRYPERVQHYVRLLSDPAHANSYPGFIHLMPYGEADSGLFTILDGHHRYLASVICGRSHVLALILVEPQQTPSQDSVARRSLGLVLVRRSGRHMAQMFSIALETIAVFGEIAGIGGLFYLLARTCRRHTSRR